MTLSAFFGALRRHWLVALIVCLLATPVFAAVVMTPPLFASRAAVYFIQPASSSEPNVLGATRTSIISTAGVIQRAVQGHQATRVISDDVSLTDMGVREGTFIRLPNSGGQWANNFETPALIVEAVDADPGAVRARMTETLNSVNDSLTGMQTDTGAQTTTWITTRTEPQDLTVTEVSGSTKRALLYLCLLVVGAVVAVVVHLEMRDARRQMRDARRRGDNISGLPFQHSQSPA